MWSASPLRLYAVTLLSLMTVFTDASISSNLTVISLPESFTPPSVFENTNLVRNINLERSYPRETTNLVVKNIGSQPQSEYYYHFPSELVPNVGGLEVKDKRDTESGSFRVELAQYGSSNPNSYFLVHFPQPLKPSESITISVSYALLSTVQPLPALIEQLDQQALTYAFSAYLPSAYPASMQKTKLKLPNGNPKDFTKLSAKNADGQSDPVHQGTSLTYGPYKDVKPFRSSPVSVRYDFTHPLLRATKLERDIEVSHWGGNLAVEERYWLTNRAAKLKKQFSRVQWQMAQYSQPPTTAVKELRLPLVGGAADPYYTDDIGNVSTSRFRPGRREALLDIKPRYPVFGGWHYSFKVGWNAELSRFLKKTKGEQYALKVPFIEGPRTHEGIEYGNVVVRIVLPEGAKNIHFTTPVPVTSSHITNHKTFMDTTGRPTIVLTTKNAVEEWRDRGDVLVSYDYPWIESFRKPLTVTASIFGVFFTAWIVGNLDVRIGKKR